MSLNETSNPADTEKRRKLQTDLERFHCRVHQPDDEPVFTREPRVDMQSVHWRWSDLSRCSNGSDERSRWQQTVRAAP